MHYYFNYDEFPCQLPGPRIEEFEGSAYSIYFCSAYVDDYACYEYVCEGNKTVKGSLIFSQNDENKIATAIRAEI